MMTINLFAYGLLQHGDVLRQLIGDSLQGETAKIQDYTRRQLILPGFKPCAMAVPQDGQFLQGMLFRGVSPEALSVMDKFEMIDEQIYRRDTVQVVTASGESVSCYMYLQGAAITEENLGELWCETTFMEAYYEHYVSEMIPAFVDNLKDTKES